MFSNSSDPYIRGFRAQASCSANMRPRNRLKKISHLGPVAGMKHSQEP